MRKNIFVLSLTFLAALGLTSCMLQEDNLPTCPPQEECPECPQVAPQIIVKQFALTVQAGEGAEVKELTGLTEGKCESGSKITFKVLLKEHFLLDKVTVNDETLTADETGTFSFRMPNADAKLIITTLNLAADGDLLTVSKLPADFVGPATLDEFKATITEANAVDGKFFKEATLKTEYEPLKKDNSAYSRQLFDFEIQASRNGIVKKQGIQGKASEDNLTYLCQTFGQKNGYLYKVSDQSDNKTLSTKAETFKIVEDTTVELKDFEVTTAEATSVTTGYSYGKELISTYLGSTTNFKEDKTTVQTLVSENKESYTVTLSSKGNYSNYSGQEFYELKVTFDGDNFLTNSTYTYLNYGKESFDADKNLIDGAIANVTYKSVYSATRGYKDELIAEPNIDELTFKNYDILTSCVVSGDTTYKLRNNGDLFIFGNTTFKYETKGDSKAAIQPRLVGVSKGNKENVLIEGQSVKFTAPGVYSLDFDNGLGSIKTIEFNAKIPETKRINGKFESSQTFVGEPNTLSVTSTPEGSDSKVSVTAKETSAPCEIVDNKDGTFNITASAAGKVELDIVLDSNKEIKTTASFQANEKPSYDVIYSNITTKSVRYFYASYREEYIVNFNTDGTGVAYYSTYGQLDSTTTFNYTLNKETLEFNFTKFTYNGTTKFVKATVLSNEEFEITMDYFGTKTYKATLVDRKTY